MTVKTDVREAGPRRALRALAAFSALGVLVVAVPALLVTLMGALPLDLGALSPSAWGAADDGQLLLLVMVAVAWVAWAVMVLSVALETWAAVRRVPTPALPGLDVPQRWAAILVTAVLVALSPAAGTPTMATPPALCDALAMSAVAAGPLSVDRVAVEDPGPRAEGGRIARQSADRESSRAANPTVLTERHDTLWMLAEQYLGAGERYTEIVDLNRGVAQPDGRSLGAGGRIYPGWTLALPADAVVDAERPERHRVVRGDTLWQIAEDELGDPTRYLEISEANRGDLQADGHRLADPDLILPGWVLEIPTDEPADIPADDAADVPADDPARGTSSRVPVLPPVAIAPLDRAPVSSASTVTTPAQTPPPPAAAGSGAGTPILDRGTTHPPAGSAESEGELAAPTVTPSLTPAPTVTPASTLTPAPTVTPAPTAAADTDDASSGDGAAIALPAGGAVAALLLAGVGAELVRRRRQFQRHRRPGERMPIPGQGAQQVERAARTAAGEPGLALFERALVQLAEEADASGRPLPDVRLVRIAPESVVLDLAAPAGPAIAPFVTADDTRWVLSRELLAAQMPDRARAFPGLVTVGFAGPETVLLNLESVGTLCVTGPFEVVGDVLRGLAADLAFGPASALTERILCLADPAIADAVEAGDLAVEREPARAAAALAAVLAQPESTITAAGGPLLIVLCDQALGVPVPPRSGCALITGAPVVGAGATLVVHDPGMAVLLPEREHLAPQRLSPTATGDLIEALRTTDLPGQAGLWDSPVATPEIIDLRENSSDSQRARVSSQEASAADPGSADAATTPASARRHNPVPRVLLLGEVLVENAHGRCESTRIGRLAETAAFVLLNPGSRPSELQGALWPGRRSNPQTCRQMISRARTWLGRTDAGESYLMTFAESAGRLRLREEVTSDWADFQRLAEIGLADPEDTEHLTAALALVRGRPFGAVASRELPWADIHINEMISLISDVAHALAVRHEDAGRRSAARDAALRGLRTESESEILEAIVARTAT